LASGHVLGRSKWPGRNRPQQHSQQPPSPGTDYTIASSED